MQTSQQTEGATERKIVKEPSMMQCSTCGSQFKVTHKGNHECEPEQVTSFRAWYQPPPQTLAIVTQG